MAFVEADVVGLAVVGQVEVVGAGGKFGREGVDLLHVGAQAERLAHRAHFVFGYSEDLAYLKVGEAEALRAAEEFGAHARDAPAGLELGVGVVDVLQFVQEPLVDAGELVYPVDRVAGLEGRGYREYSGVGRVLERKIEVLGPVGLVAHESVRSLAYHPEAFLYGLLEVAAYRHHFAHALHARAYLAGHALEFGEIPAGYLADHVVEGRLEEGGGGLGHGVLELEQAVAEAELGGDEGEGIAGRLGCQRRRAAQAGVHLDYPVVLSVGAERILHVAFAYDAHVAHDVNRYLAQEVELLVGQRLRRGDHDALAGMDAERVEILHVADGYAVVVAVAHDLVFDFLPAPQRLLHEHLRGERERLAGDCVKLLLVLAEAGAESAQGVCRAYNHGVADAGRRSARLLKVGCGVGLDGLDSDFVELLDEELAVLGVDDRLNRRAEHPDPVFLKHSAAVEFHSAVQRGLAAEREQYALGLLLGDDLLHEVGGHRQEVDFVRHALRSLHGRDVGVDEHRGDAFFPERLECLRAAVVEFAGFADFECA